MNNSKVVVALKYFKGELNPFDCSALEIALSQNLDVTVLAMAPLSVLEQLKGITRLGVKAVLVSDSCYAGSDTIVTSLILAQAIKKLNPDYVFCGRQSVDGDTAQVPPMLAKRLNYEIFTKATDIIGNDIVLRNGKRVKTVKQAVITFEKSKKLRFPSIFSKVGDVQIWDNSILNIPVEKCGLKGSPTKVVCSYESDIGRRFCEFKSFSDLECLIKSALKKQTIDEGETASEKLNVIYYVGNVKNIAEKIAISAIMINVKGKSAEEIARFISANQVEYVIWEDSESLKILSAQVAVLLNAGLCADCISFSVQKAKLIMTRPAQGGTVTADIEGTTSVTMATVRTVKEEGSEIVFSIGKGAVGKKQEIIALAKKYGAEVCCSRIVADNGDLPYECQVGLTGKTVYPKVYVAFGISGAVQHTCAISGARTVIAINSDKDARIFDFADYGIIENINKIF